jgi:hypothetical protein
MDVMAGFSKRKIIWAVLCVALFSTLLTVSLYWRQLVTNHLQSILHGYGLESVELFLSSAGWHSATIDDISIGNDRALTLKNLVVGFTPDELRHGRLRTITINKLALSARQVDGRWIVPGLESFFKSGKTSEPWSLPVTAAELNILPFDSLEMRDSILAINAPNLQTTLPLYVDMKKTPVPSLLWKGDALSMQSGDAQITIGHVDTALQLDDASKQWKGDWVINDLAIKKGSALPAMDGKGTLTISNETLSLRGVFTNAAIKSRAEILLNTPLHDTQSATLTILNASIPWKQGTISVRNVKIPVFGTKPIAMTIHINGVSIDEMMQSLTGKRISATGTVSGSLPLSIGRDGAFSILEGVMTSQDPGVISIPPDLIPGDNPNLALARDLLKDLHYSNLTIGTNNEGKGVAVRMTVEGNNPAVLNGRPVKLNVALKGDFIDLVRQNIMILSNPQTMLDRKKP